LPDTLNLPNSSPEDKQVSVFACKVQNIKQQEEYPSVKDEGIASYVL
jgi:hypothetical protein